MQTHTSPSEVIQKAFPGITKEEAQDMADSGYIQDYPPETVLCREGAIEKIFYIIIDGEVKVTKLLEGSESRFLTNLSRGDFFGEMALIHNAPRAASVITTQPTTVIEINKDNFNILLNRNASVSLAMVREVSRRLRENDEMAIEDLRVKSQELALAYQQLAEQEYAQHEFLSTVAHELRTPLTTSYGYIQAIQMKMVQDESYEATLKTVSDNLQKIISLVNDILFLQEMELILLEFKPIDLAEIAMEVIDQQRERAITNGVELDLSIHPALPKIKGDARSLERVIHILVDNAIKFSPEGGDIRVDVDSDGEEVWLSVSDTGVGIPSEAMPRLFRRYFRLDEVGGYLFTGTGMGLSIARQVVEQHNGRIDVESELGKGSQFTIRFQQFT